MRHHKKRLTGVIGLAALAASAGAMFIGASAASAATPPYEPDPSPVGTLTFYDSSGNVTTTGRTDTAPFAAYAVGSTAVRSGDIKAALYFAAPDPGKTPDNYYVEQVGSFNTYPLTSGPANLQALGADVPVNAGKSTNQTLDGFRTDLSNPSTATGYDQVVQVRLRTANSASQITQTYDDADVLINPATHTWTQVYPAPKTATATSLSAAPSPATVGQSVTLTASETPAVAGSVQFQDGSTAIGAPVAVNGSGAATKTTSTLTQGSHSLSAVFTPTDTSTYVGSTGTTTLTVNPASTPTTTSLAVTQDGTAGDAATLSATVTGPGTTPNSSGSVSFYDNGSSTALGTVPGSAAVNGVYTLTLPTGFAAGPHSIVAKFAPTDYTVYQASQSGPQGFTTQAPQVGACAATGSACVDQQNTQVTVPSGTLVINTPYTPSNPLHLGTMAPNSAGTQLTASKPFQNIVITDTRSGVSGYTVSAQSSTLTDGNGNAGSTINSQNVGLTGVTATGGTGFTGTITPHSNAAADPALAPGAAGTAGLGNAAHPVLDVTGTSRGTVTANGTLTINAPTSTEPGLFTGTITFTVG